MELLFNEDESTIAMGMAICWAIWKARNAKVFEHQTANVQETLATALFWYNLFYNYSDDEESQLLQNNKDNSAAVTDIIWSAPNNPFIKINVDAAWKDGMNACAAVAIDSNGLCWGAGTRLGRTDTVVYAETDGFKLATDLASWLNLNHIIIEGDSQLVVKSLQGELRTVPWRIWRLKDEITKWMNEHNSSGAYNYIPKMANSAAHNLAVYAFSHNVQNMWTSSSSNIPPSIVNLWDVNNS
ncbi:uncharacterized protein LOC113290771 [Papaver somniferum]|uniref:uncharacterized protein LOC113290771 n=1 Tax=Papaver somniferum TaxID=3469 RepID=UPI000E6F996F|nr:uncharacterized protein LOC113290771 [Papaver somniferum]